jgi:hypothetical protein
MAANVSFSSVVANAKFPAVNIPQQVDFILDAISNVGPWTAVFTIVALLVAYDQCESQDENGCPIKEAWFNNPPPLQLAISGTRVPLSGRHLRCPSLGHSWNLSTPVSSNTRQNGPVAL